MKILICLLSFVALWWSAAVAAAGSPFFYQSLSEDARVKMGFVEDCHQPGLADGDWRLLKPREVAEQQHYCIRIPVRLEHPAAAGISLKVLMLASAEVYWDGEPVGNKGLPGRSLAEEQTGPIALTAPLSVRQLAPGRHLLSMRISSYHHVEDMYQIYYGAMLLDDRAFGAQLRQGMIAPLLLCGAMLLLVLVFQLIYWRYQRDPAFMLFSLLCLSSGLLIGLELLKFFYAYPWDWHVYRLRLIIVVTLCLAASLLCYYLCYYRMTLRRRWLGLAALLLVALAVWVPSYDGKSLALFFATLGLGLAINQLAVVRRLPGAQLNRLSLLLGLMSLILLPYSFIEQWFAALFSVLAVVNLYTLAGRFGRDREKAMLSLRLEAEMLRRNIQPHFILNSLMLIIEWIETRPRLAIDFIEALAREFGLLNAMSKKALVPLSQEIELCRQHIAIMSYRYELDILLKVTGDIEGITVPPALLHTVVENAFSHNKLVGEDCFELSVVRHGQEVEIVMISPRRQRSHQGSGAGEQYIRTRLAQSFDQAWQYHSARVGDSWQTRFVLPAMSEAAA